MKFWNIWCEGYSATGNSAPAKFIGTIEASTFQEACELQFSDDGYFDKENLTYWSCRLFDNEADARKNFG